MIKNIILLGLLSWVSFSYAKGTQVVVQESMKDAETYKVEPARPEQEPARKVAGSKIKKKADKGEEPVEARPSETDSEVRYWQYSE